MNKIDLVNQGFVREVQSKIGSNFIPISADADVNIDALKEEIYKKLDFIRIYMHQKGKETDFKEPMIMQNGSNVGDVCNKIHRSMIRDFKYAQIWGKSAKFGGQKVGMRSSARRRGRYNHHKKNLIDFDTVRSIQCNIHGFRFQYLILIRIPLATT